MIDRYSIKLRWTDTPASGDRQVMEACRESDGDFVRYGGHLAEIQKLVWDITGEIRYRRDQAGGEVAEQLEDLAAYLHKKYILEAK